MLFDKVIIVIFIHDLTYFVHRNFNIAYRKISFDDKKSSNNWESNPRLLGKHWMF